MAIIEPTQSRRESQLDIFGGGLLLIVMIVAVSSCRASWAARACSAPAVRGPVRSTRSGRTRRSRAAGTSSTGSARSARARVRSDLGRPDRRGAPGRDRGRDDRGGCGRLRHRRAGGGRGRPDRGGRRHDPVAAHDRRQLVARVRRPEARLPELGGRPGAPTRRRWPTTIRVGGPGQRQGAPDQAVPRRDRRAAGAARPLGARGARPRGGSGRASGAAGRRAEDGRLRAAVRARPAGDPGRHARAPRHAPARADRAEGLGRAAHARARGDRRARPTPTRSTSGWSATGAGSVGPGRRSARSVR